MDSFDDIWKNSFNAEELPSEGWNTPSDEVWSAVVKQLPEQNKRRPFWLWLVAGIATLLTICTSFLVCNPFSSETSNAQGFSSTVPSNISVNKIDVDKSISSKEESFDYQPEKQKIKQTPVHTRNISSSKTKRPSRIKELKVTQTTIQMQGIVKEEIVNIIDKNTQQSTIIGIVENIATEEHVIREKLNPDSPLQQGVEFLQNAIPNYFATPIFINDRKESLLSLSITTGVTNWQHRLANNFEAALSPFDFNYKNGIGQTIGLEGILSLNRNLQLFIGINYDRVQTKSGHNSTLNYSVLNEAQNSNQYILALATPYGFMDSEFSILRSQNLEDEQVDLLADFASEHTIHNWSLPIGTRFFWNSRKRFSPYVSLGFGINYLSRINNNLNTINTHHSALKYTSDSANIKQSNYTKWHWDSRLGGGLQYRWDRQLKISLNYTYTYGLSPVFRLDDFTTRINRHYYTLTVTKRL